MCSYSWPLLDCHLSSPVSGGGIAYFQFLFCTSLCDSGWLTLSQDVDSRTRFLSVNLSWLWEDCSLPISLLDTFFSFCIDLCLILLCLLSSFLSIILIHFCHISFVHLVERRLLPVSVLSMAWGVMHSESCSCMSWSGSLKSFLHSSSPSTTNSFPLEILEFFNCEIYLFVL